LPAVTIVTDANALMRPLHDRMLVILAPEDYGAWFDGATAPNPGREFQTL